MFHREEMPLSAGTARILALKMNTISPILIRTKVQNGMMFVFIYSSDSINYTPKQIPSSTFRQGLFTNHMRAVQS